MDDSWQSGALGGVGTIVAAMIAWVSARHRYLNHVRVSASGTTERLAQVETKVDAISAAIIETKESVERIAGKLDRIDDVAGELGERIARIEGPRR